MSGKAQVHQGDIGFVFPIPLNASRPLLALPPPATCLAGFNYGRNPLVHQRMIINAEHRIFTASAIYHARLPRSDSVETFFAHTSWTTS